MFVNKRETESAKIKFLPKEEVKTMYKKKVKAKLKKLPRKSDEDNTFNVPKKLYLKLIEDFKSIKKSSAYGYTRGKFFDDEFALFYCHKLHSGPLDVSKKRGLFKNGNFLMAAKQAFDARDYKSVYRICSKGFEMRDRNLYDALYQVILHFFRSFFEI